MSTEPKITEMRFTEGRRGFAGDADLAVLPKRRIYATIEDAHARMAGNDIAYTIYFTEGGTFERRYHYEVCAMAEYVRIERAKRSAPWTEVARGFGTCSACAYEALGAEWGELVRVIPDREWTEVKAKQESKKKKKA